MSVYRPREQRRMTDDANIVFHGFLNLTNLEKLELVNAINEYFDATDKEPIRAARDAEFQKVGPINTGKTCKCCGR